MNKTAVLKEEYFDDLIGFMQVSDIGLKSEVREKFLSNENEIISELREFGFIHGTDNEEADFIISKGTKLEIIESSDERFPFADDLKEGEVYLLPINAKFTSSGIVVMENHIERVS